MIFTKRNFAVWIAAFAATATAILPAEKAQAGLTIPSPNIELELSPSTQTVAQGQQFDVSAIVKSLPAANNRCIFRDCELRGVISFNETGETFDFFELGWDGSADRAISR